MRHLETRRKIITGQIKLELHNFQQERNAARDQQQILNTVERQYKVGDRLRDLIFNREEIDRFLEKTIEFNERFFDPQSWHAKMRQKQRVE